MAGPVVLTFDLDGWRAFGDFEKLEQDVLLQEGIPRIIEFLERKNLDATFFVVGQNLRDFPRLHLRLASYEIGNHTLTHPPDLNRKSPRQKRHEISVTHELIGDLFRIEPRIFRAPHYMTDRETIRILKEMGYAADSSLLRVLFPFNYAFNYLRNRHLARDEFEIPLTSYVLPFNGTAAVNYRMPLTRMIFKRLCRKGQPLVLNFHAKDFVNIKLKRWRLRNRERSLPVTLEFLELITSSCPVLSIREYLQHRKRDGQTGTDQPG